MTARGPRPKRRRGGAANDSREPRSDPRTSGGPARPSPRAPRNSGAFIAAALAALALLALITWSLRGRLFTGRAQQAAGVAQSPVPGMTLQQEAAVATRLVNEKRSIESLPYYRHLLAVLPDNWQVRFGYVTAISNTALESRGRPLNGGPCARSSFERVAMVREAFAQLDTVARYVTSPHEFAMVLEHRGRLYKNWGFPWDALVELRAAQQRDPGWQEVAANADFYSAVMHHPEAVLDSINARPVPRH